MWSATVACLFVGSVLIGATASQTAATNGRDLFGPAGSESFGGHTLVLSNGNYVVSDPLFDSATLGDVGAVYLYDGANNQVISTLVGSHANDQIGGGLTEVGTSDFVVESREWNNVAEGLLGMPGAITWVDGTTGLDGQVSSANSLVKTGVVDFGIRGVTALSNGNYVVASPHWRNGLTSDFGAVTWGSGTTGVHGAVSAANSLVGSVSSDQVGSMGVTALSNGNYVVISPLWNRGAAIRAGAVTWGNGSTGISGAVTAANSLVGTVTNDSVGIRDQRLNGVTALPNGNYVVTSDAWNNGMVNQVGAVTWGNGSSGTSGAVSLANSMVGASAGDFVGFNGVVVLTNGNYVVNSPLWDNGAVLDTGAITWGSGTSATVGIVGSANSLVGSSTTDRIGTRGPSGTPIVVALTNGNYVVPSPLWDNGAVVDAGAATWGNGATGTHGALTSSNSLVGTAANDQVGFFGLAALTNGNYVVASRFWDNGLVADAGAVTWGNGASGVSGAVTAANSLVGTALGNRVGSDITSLTNGNYVVTSFDWDNGGPIDIGAVTWRNGAIATSGAVTAANSLIGSSAGDQIGVSGSGVTALSNGNYVVGSQLWANSGAAEAGAATWGNGTAGTTGVVGPANSLIGTTAFDRVGVLVTALTDGNYVVDSPLWDSAVGFDSGAVTWGNGLGGTNGAISAANSMVSPLPSLVGEGGVTALPGGAYTFTAPAWHNPGGFSIGAVTYGPAGGISGLIAASNSVFGTSPGTIGSVSTRFTTDDALVISTSQNRALLLRVGAQSPKFTSVPANITVDAAPGALNASVTYAVPAATGNGATPSVVCNPPSGSLFPIGVTSVTCAAKDGTGYSATTSFTITVNETVVVTPPHPSPPPFAPQGFVALTPARLADTRAGGSTVDSLFSGGGPRPSGSTLQLVVAGRGDVAADAAAVALNVTVAEPTAAGFVTVYPCGSPVPTASNLNYTTAAVIPNAVIAKVGAEGTVCLFTSAPTHLIVDVNGYFPAASGLHSINPARVLETRTGLTTADGLQQGIGLRGPGSITALQIAGRVSVPTDATAVVLNVTVTEAQAPGYVTVYPCGSPVPTASSINYSTGSTVANLVVTKIGPAGTVCLFTQSGAHLVADLNGYFPISTTYQPVVPARLLETRPSQPTIDAQFAGAGMRPGGTVTQLPVTNRGGVPAAASMVILNVTVTGAVAPGFVTVYPCGLPVPLASNLNYEIGTTAANATLVKVGANGSVCLYNSGATHLIADVDGYLPV